MIKSTFCHLTSISQDKEMKLWGQGIYTWDDLLCYAAVYWNDELYFQVNEEVKRSSLAFHNKDIGFFLKLLPPTEAYRVYPVFAEQLTYLDIETTGLEKDALITVVSLLNCEKMHTFIQSVDLEVAKKFFVNTSMSFVTFNGTKFDIPRVKNKFPQFNPKHHIDLAKVFRAYGLKGKFKEIAKSLGCYCGNCNDELSSGADAAEAWRQYKSTGDRLKLKALIRYNQRDVKLLEELLRFFYIRQCKRYSLPYEL